MATSEQTVDESIKESLQDEKVSVVDGQRVEAHSLHGQIAAANHLAANANAKKDRCGIGFRKLSPPGTA